MNRITQEAVDLITTVRNQMPLVHQITNYVTVNDCANITLAIGASPIMADDIGEAADITAISSVLVLNIGTLNERTVTSMLAAGEKANALGIPVVFDPVGAGASKLRNDTTQAVLEQIKLAIVRGNRSEIAFIAGGQASTRGVDASEADAGKDSILLARQAACQLGCVVAVTGQVDVISDGERTVTIANGHTMLSRITGTGCMATALAGACAGATHDFLLAATAGVAVMGIAGEIAFARAGDEGIGSFRAALLDAVSRMDRQIMETRARINEI